MPLFSPWRLVTLVALIFLASPAVAQSLQGRWEVNRNAFNGPYTGVFEIDGTGKVRMQGESPGTRYSQCGRLIVNGSRIEVAFETAQPAELYNPDHFYCTAPTPETLRCYNIDSAGDDSGGMFTVRKLSGPAGRYDAADEFCPLREMPLSGLFRSMVPS
jgi:hypothetical protein